MPGTADAPRSVLLNRDRQRRWRERHPDELAAIERARSKGVLAGLGRPYTRQESWLLGLEARARARAGRVPAHWTEARSLLEDGPITARNLATAVWPRLREPSRADLATLAAALHRLKNRGLLVRVRVGVYDLPERHPDLRAALAKELVLKALGDRPQTVTTLCAVAGADRPSVQAILWGLRRAGHAIHRRLAPVGLWRTGVR